MLLEALQSFIADSDPNDGAILAPPNPSKIGHALSWTYLKIKSCEDISEVERLESLLRWHAVSLEAVIKTPQLSSHICKQWKASQDLWSDHNFREQPYNLPGLIASPSGRKALLHAVAIQDTVEQLPRGRA